MPMRTRTHPLTLIAALVGLVIWWRIVATVQANDPAIGTWVLNYGKVGLRSGKHASKKDGDVRGRA